jgi:enoyl-CoA hydratase/carnithine racemase
VAVDAEVVTEAKVRYVSVPDRSGERAVGFALVTIDNEKDHTRPTTFGPQGLASLATALENVGTVIAAGQDIQAVAVTGKPFVFSVGADLKVFGQLKSRDDVLEIARLGHATFR